jgi:hypothetical protein
VPWGREPINHLPYMEEFILAKQLGQAFTRIKL